MPYRKPFTPQQRREALRALGSYQKHERLLRRKYPATTTMQAEVMKDYTGAIANFKDELKKSDRLINLTAVNRLDVLARWLALEYWRLRNTTR